MKKKVIIIIGLLVVGYKGYSQSEKQGSFSFSVKQAVEYALQNQNDVKNAIIDEELAHKKVAEIRATGFPQINSSFDMKDFEEIPTTVLPDFISPTVYAVNQGAFGLTPRVPYQAGDGIPAQFGTRYNSTAGLDASQMLFNSDYFLGLKGSKVFIELSTRSLQRTKVETTAAVSKAYYMVLINTERTKLMDANIARLKKTLDDTKALMENGFVEKLDVDRLTVTYNNLLVEQEKIKRLLSVGTYLLKYQMGMDINSDLTLTDKLDDVKFDIGTLAQVEKFDYSKRIEYGIMETNMKLAKLDLKRQRYSFLPYAFLYGSLSGSAQRNEFNIFDTKKPWYPTALIGGTIKMPIFTGFQRNIKNQEAKLSLQKAQNNVEFIKKSIDLDLASTSANLTNAASSLENQKKNIKLAEDIVSVSKKKYDQGVGSNLEMVNAETSLKEAQTNYYNALYDAIIAKIDYDKANGNLK